MQRLFSTALIHMLSKIVLRDPDDACWYQYENPVRVIVTSVVAEVVAALRKIEDLVETQGWFAAGYVGYEAAAGFDPKLATHQPGSLLPLVCFGLFPTRVRLESLTAGKGPGELGFDGNDEPPAQWRMVETAESYQARVELIKSHIAAGETYQINLTTRLQSESPVNFATFCRIAGNAPYAAFICAEGFDIVSASPELFFQCDRDTVVCRPMKGTAPRGFSTVQDRAQAQWLRHSEKNRAENLMITDMVRNDLGRVAIPGSVETTNLFDVKAHQTVWQMTSTVRARTSLGVADLFAVLFPGASITGAPKRASMAFIKQLEPDAREVYTGAIGMLAPGRVARFNIAIRTAWSDKRKNTSFYGAGCGIVWDSDPAAELRELQLKTQVLDTRRGDFRLIETMRGTSEGIFLLAQHLSRLQDSAGYFDFAVDIHSIRSRLEALENDHDVKVRLTLASDGDVDIAVSEIPRVPGLQPMMLALDVVDRNQPWLYHKTTRREVYERARLQVAEDCEAVLVNSEGFITESVIANIVYQLDGRLFTPPVTDGLLPGTLRTLEVVAGRVAERSLHVSQVIEVQRWFLVNALRGWREAFLRRSSEFEP